MLLVALALGACSKAEDTSAPAPAPGDGACVDDRSYFAHEVFWPVLNKTCIACHNPQGQANESKLVLASTWQTGFLEQNLETLRQVAAFEVEGRSIVLIKPTGGLAHQGGALLAAGSPELTALEGMVARFKAPVTCPDGGGAPVGAETELLDPAETLRKASLALAGRLPTAAELEGLRTGGPGALAAALRDLTEEDAFYEWLETAWNDRLLTDRYLGGENALNLIADEDFPSRRWYQDVADATLRNLLRDRANRAVAREALALVTHVVREGRPFTEVLTADYVLVNAYSARSYGLSMGAFPDGADPEAFAEDQLFEARLPDRPHAGVLTTPVFLNRFPTTVTNVNRHRSRVVFDLFLATDVMKLAERPVDPTSIEDFNPTLYNPACAVCHAVIDPLAGTFQNWNERGQYRPPEGGWNQDMRPPGFDGREPVPAGENPRSLAWLAARIARDERFATAVVHTMYRALTGREPALPPTQVSTAEDAARLAAFEAQAAVFDRIAAAFRASDHDLRTVIVGLIESPYYRARALRPGADGALADSFGTGRLLTPEQLHRKIRAVLGLEWTRSGRPVLLSSAEFRIFYGGIDSDQVTERIRQPNGIMASIAMRMANELACAVTAPDFVRAPEDRLLFPHVEPSFVPRDANGFDVPEAELRIRKNLQHLHARLLGESLALDDPELDRSYALWKDTWLEGQAALQLGAASANLNGACQASRDPDTGEALPNERRITVDRSYAIRAWSAVLTYLLSDWAFLYE